MAADITSAFISATLGTTPDSVRTPPSTPGPFDVFVAARIAGAQAIIVTHHGSSFAVSVQRSQPII